MSNHNFNRIVNSGNFSKLVGACKKPCLFLLDTSSIIDIENEYFIKGRNNGHIHPGKIWDRISMEYPLIITPEILREVREHRLCRIGRRNEIS